MKSCCHRHDCSTSRLTLRAVALLFLLTMPPLAAKAGDNSRHLVAAVRRPVAIVVQNGRVFVGNRETGSISVIEANSRQVRSETTVAARIDDLVALPDANRLLAVDSKSDQLLVVRLAGDSTVVEHRIPVARFPVGVCTSRDGMRISVAGLWSRQLSIIPVVKSPTTGGADSSAVSVLRETRIDLPFAPLRQCVLDERHILVAGAFGGQLAVVDVLDARVDSVLEINGHNIRGLSLSADRSSVVLAHQRIHSIASTTRSVISWGGVVSNMLQAIPVDALLSAESKTLQDVVRIHGRLYPLGQEGNAAGDPGAVIIDESGRTIVALAGVHEVAIRNGNEREINRIRAGRHPSALAINQPAGQLYVASKFDDSVAVVDLTENRTEDVISLGRKRNPNLRQRGEELFYDARLSLAGWFSCHSCHSDGHSSGLLNDNFGDGSFNTPKRILSLRGTADTEPWGWTGSQIDLKNQIHSSIESTMGGPGRNAPPLSSRNLDAMRSFLGSLPPAPSLTRTRGTMDAAARDRGEKVFRRRGCFTCHPAPRFASSLRFDVGIYDEGGYSKFNPPSLRGVSQRGPYFHDNRAATLREVFHDHDHDGASDLSNSDLNDLIEYLRSL